MMRALSLFTTLKELKSDRLVTIYGVDLNADRFAKSRFTELDIYMEYMEKGSFDKIYGRIGYIPIEIVGEVALAVSEALSFMFDDHNVVPRCAYLFLSPLTRIPGLALTHALVILSLH
jgi:hypothetical protein